MSTEKQKAEARRNIKKAQQASRTGRRGRSEGMSTAEQNDLRDSSFAFPKQRKEPLNDARHVRNAIARFDQVEGVTNSERQAAWRRIKTAAKKFGVEVTARGWRQLMKGGRTGRSRSRSR